MQSNSFLSFLFLLFLFIFPHLHLFFKHHSTLVLLGIVFTKNIEIYWHVWSARIKKTCALSHPFLLLLVVDSSIQAWSTPLLFSLNLFLSSTSVIYLYPSSSTIPSTFLICSCPLQPNNPGHSALRCNLKLIEGKFTSKTMKKQTLFRRGIYWWLARSTGRSCYQTLIRAALPTPPPP